MLKNLFRHKPKLRIEVSGHSITWEVDDGRALQLFLNGETGVKFRKIVDNFILQHGFNPNISREELMGMLRLYEFIITRVPVNGTRGNNATSGHNTDGPATGGSIIFPDRRKKK